MPERIDISDAEFERVWREVAATPDLRRPSVEIAKRLKISHRNVLSLQRRLWGKGVKLPSLRITPAATVEAPANGVENTSVLESTIEENRQLRSLLKRERSEDAFQEMLLAALKGAVGSIRTPPAMPVVRPSKTLTETSLILCMSDHHGNRVVDPRAIEGLNEYDFDIYADRLWYIILRTIMIAQAQYTSANRISDLYVIYLGDIGNDCHRQENVATNAMAENAASLVSASINAQAIDALLRAKTPDGGHALFPVIHFLGVVGNEPRMDKKVNHSQPWRNWDWLIYQQMSLMLGGASERLRTFIPWSPKVQANVKGWEFLITHGDDIRSWAGIPFYGIQRSNAREQHVRRERGGFDFRLMGHFHIDAKLPIYARNTFLNPSLVGVDGFAHNGLGVTSLPAQLLLAVTEEVGVIGEHVVYAMGVEKSPFAYDIDLAVHGAMEMMDRWRTGKAA